MRPILGRTFAAAWLLSMTAAAQQERWTFHGEDRRQDIGWSACWLSDLDGDGLRDFAVGLLPSGSVPSTGAVRLCSGRDGALIREWNHADRATFGRLVVNAGDLDGDGFDDVLVGAASNVGHIDDSVSGWSSATGALLFELKGAANAFEHFGASLAALGDVDGDGTDDFAIGTSYRGSSPAGFVEFRSGSDQKVLGTVTGPNAAPLFGDHDRIAAVGDLDGDGVQDLLTAETFKPTTANLPNCNVDVWSGATRASLLHVTVLVPQWQSNQQLSVANVGDADGDGTTDLLVAAPRTTSFQRPARALLLSGATGATLQTVFEPAAGNLGRLCFAAGDVDRDGFADFGVAANDPAGDYLTIRSGSSGGELLRMVDDAPGQQLFARALAAGPDVDGDGISELLIGCPEYFSGTGYHPTGSVQCRSLADDSILWLKEGVLHKSHWRSDVAFVDDQDGDGLPELAMTDSTTWYANTKGKWALVLRSGSDGHELRRQPNVPPLMGRFVALPDFNGDGVTDFAASAVAWWAQYVTYGPAPFVEQVDLRSGADLSLLGTLQTALPDEYFGYAVAGGLQPGGAVHVACGAPLHGPAYGQLAVHDAATGALVFAVTGDPASTTGQFGTSVAFAGDLDGDGVGDWAVGAPGHSSAFNQGGRVAFVSGVNGASLGDLFGTFASQRMGIAVVAIGDHDGDGLDELAVVSDQPSSTSMLNQGKVELYSSSTRTAYATIVGHSSFEQYGRSLVAVPDLNGDGERDFVVGVDVAALGRLARLELRSGHDGALLKYIEPRGAEYGLAWLGAAPPPWLPTAPPGADGPWLASVEIGASLDGYLTGRVALYELDNLYLDVFPAGAGPGGNVEAATRGGPAGALAGLFIESIDGVPFGQFLAFGTFDAASSFVVTDTVPPGLSGQEWLLRGYGVGWNGRLVESQTALMEFW